MEKLTCILNSIHWRSMRIFSGIKYYLTPQWEKLFTMKVIKMLLKTIKKVQMTLRITKMVDISLVSLLRVSSVILVTRLEN